LTTSTGRKRDGPAAASVAGPGPAMQDATLLVRLPAKCSWVEIGPTQRVTRPRLLDLPGSLAVDAAAAFSAAM
jgi:hypothetical protein